MKKIIVLLIVMLFALGGCTENQRAKQFGGHGNITLPKGQKLVIATWKDDNLWYLTRPMRPNESPETYTFSEESSWGVFEGSYTIKEIR
jgi:hypothetical protein